MSGRHRGGLSVARLMGAVWRRRMIEMVDARSHVAHVVSEAAVVAGRRGGGRYYALCGVQVRPASLTVAGRQHCRPCRTGAAS